MVAIKAWRGMKSRLAKHGKFGFSGWGRLRESPPQMTPEQAKAIQIQGMLGGGFGGSAPPAQDQGSSKESEDLVLGVEELAVRVRELSDVVEELLSSQEHSPDWESGFILHYRDADANGDLTIKHHLGYVPNNWFLGRIAAARTVGFTIPPVWGSARIANNTRTEAQFQFDQAALDSHLVLTVFPARSAIVRIGDGDG